MNKFAFIKEKWDWKPHLSQKEFMAFDSKIKIAACGRRWGKTEASAYDMAYYFLTEENYSQMIVSPTYDQSKLIFRTLESLLKDMKNIEIKRSPYSYMKLKNNIITARTADNDGTGLRGNKADRIVVDEAAYIKDAVIYEVISPMLADTNGDLVLISTPFGKNHFYDFYKKGIKRTKECASFSYKSVDNPYISKEYIERQRENISQISFETEYEAKFCDNVSNVFKTDSIKEAVEKNMSVEGCVVIGVDFARYKDWTVACVLRSDGERCEMLKQLRFNKVSWKAEIDNILNLVYEFKPIKLICDATGVGDPLCENLERLLIEENSPCEVVRFKFTNESKNIIVDYVNLLLDTGRISLLEDPVLIKEMENFEYSLTETGSVKLEAKYNFHDDTVCALALACHGGKDITPPGGMYSW